jgi:hypothetical protein
MASGRAAARQKAATAENVRRRDMAAMASSVAAKM